MADDVTPMFKEGAGAEKAAAPTKKASTKKAAGAKKGATKKAAAAKKAAAKKAATDRRASIVSKEGTKKDAFTGEVLPVTAFPTIRNSKTGVNDSRGPVARKNLEAWRADKAKKREAEKAAKEKKAAADKAAKAAAKAKETAKAAG